MSNIPVALQLFSVRDQFTADPRGTLKAVSEMGYDGVEFWATPTKYDPVELRGYLDEFGLRCCGWHTPAKWFLEENLEVTVSFMRTLGTTLLTAWMPADLNRESLVTRADWMKVVSFLNLAQQRLAPHGLRVGYHNHEFEFMPVEGELPWDIIFSNVHQDVIMQLDTGNGAGGGCNVIDTLTRYAERAVTVHLKPYKKPSEGQDPSEGYRPLIGEDDLPWKDILRCCESGGYTKWYIIEYESDAHSPMDAVFECLQVVRAIQS